MAAGKQLGISLRFVYGCLKGFILISMIYMAIAATIIAFHPEAFSIYIIEYIKTPEYSKLRITLFGYLLMAFNGILELIKLRDENIKNRRRRKKNE
ncbi:hypothetical protein [Geosporobacter ferrireducens]|uniref:Uncharacterized protein n=1 Tax=Geosporobacter ferrireducens TaxID=1424294 RepID=A0A1D8GH87_9FIRM|nr:hypothetical protein [Geosporobacter ferrireducens]AOT70276.1 hypothetical protein Gferi_12125 [Geosporobacter ferrireducens]MTI55762.1 hypothetical protein [Geosporobacter ferrireducens]